MSEIKYETKVIGCGLLVKEMLDELQVSQIIDECLEYQPEIAATYGELAQTVIINRMNFEPVPLYELSRWAENKGIDKLLGLEASWLDDDRMGAMLDGIAKHPVEIWSELIKRVVEKGDLNPEFLNMDTTSIYFEGQYENRDGTPKDDPNGPLLVEGYNKDGKRKKAQYVLSLTNSGRIPLWYKPWDGNQSDDGVYLADYEELQKSDLNLENTVLVGDRKLCNQKTMLGLERTEQQFLAPFAWRDTAKNAWRATWKKVDRGEIEWVDVDYVSRNQEKKPVGERTQYKACEVPYTLVDRQKDTSYELRWVFSWSSDKAERDKKKREKAIAAGQEQLAHVQRLLGKYDYKDRKTIKKRISSRLQKHSANHLFDFTLSGTATKQNWQLNWKLNHSALKDEQKFDGIALFCTNVSQQRLSTAEVIITYKQQINVEQSISFIKTPIRIRPMWLNLPRRIAGLTLLVMIAVLISSLIEHIVRQHVATTGELIHGLMPENRDNPFPTATKILQAFQDYAFVIVQHSNSNYEVHYPDLRPVQQLIWNVISPSRSPTPTLSGG